MWRHQMKRARRVLPNESDIAWAEERTIALMKVGFAFVNAADIAARECTQRVLDREEKAIVAWQDERDGRHDERVAMAKAEYEERRAELNARATLAQRPSLQTTLGDLLNARGKR
jgi:hypothetical protein